MNHDLNEFLALVGMDTRAHRAIRIYAQQVGSQFVTKAELTGYFATSLQMALYDAAIKCLNKEEADASELVARRAALLAKDPTE